jgi:hypothetical protein
VTSQSQTWWTAATMRTVVAAETDLIPGCRPLTIKRCHAIVAPTATTTIAWLAVIDVEPGNLLPFEPDMAKASAPAGGEALLLEAFIPPRAAIAAGHTIVYVGYGRAEAGG